MMATKQECHDGYEYTFVSGSIKDIVTKFSKKMLTLSDDHLRFSLFDSAMVEKKYDIDLSSVIRLTAPRWKKNTT